MGGMSQCDTSLFVLVIRGLFFISAFGFGIAFFHFFFFFVSTHKLFLNYLAKVVKLEKKLQFFVS